MLRATANCPNLYLAAVGSGDYAGLLGPVVEKTNWWSARVFAHNRSTYNLTSGFGPVGLKAISGFRSRRASLSVSGLQGATPKQQRRKIFGDCQSTLGLMATQYCRLHIGVHIMVNIRLKLALHTE